MAVIKDGKIEFEQNDYYTDYSGGHAQKILTPAALEQRTKLRAQLKIEETDRSNEIAAQKTRTIAQQKADEKRAKIEQQRKAEAARSAALHAQLDNELTAFLRRANPGISDDDIQTALPELRKRHHIEQAERVQRDAVRQYLATLNDGL